MSTSDHSSTVRGFPIPDDLMTSSPSLADLIETTGHALTADELAPVLAVPRITIFKQAKAGRIPSFRIGHMRAFRPSLCCSLAPKKLELSRQQGM